MNDRILITGCTLLAGAWAPLLGDSFIEVDSSRIVSHGPMRNCPENDGYFVIDARAKLVMPGLVNGHNHCAMTLFRGIADDLNLHDWLHNHIFPAEAAHISEEMVYWCAKLAAAEMISSGTTCVGDGYFFSGMAAQAFFDTGMRAVVGHGIVDFPVPSVPDPAKNIETVDQFIRQWHNVSPLISPAVFAHAPYTCSPETLVSAKRLADRSGVRFFTHLAETREELAHIIDPRADSPVRHLDALGLLDEMTTAIHTVWLDEDDIKILAARGTSVITCPQSNAKLAAGIAPVSSLLGANISVGIGTDGCASNNSLDLFREMDMLAKLQKLVQGDATAMAARDVLHCATDLGAAAIGVPDCGRVENGMAADLIFIDLDQPRLTPFYNQDLLVYGSAGSDVDSVIINGRLVMHNRKILSFDVDEAVSAVLDLAGTTSASQCTAK